MEEKRKIEFPKGFFQKARPTISNKETLKDVTPIQWTTSKLKNSKVVAYSPKEKKVL